MTAFGARNAGKLPNSNNIKDGGRRQLFCQQTGFWGVENFIPVQQGEWRYTWEGLTCPVFKVVEDADETTATLEGGIEITFSGTSCRAIKDILDTLILELMRLQDDDSPLTINGQEIGPEVAF